MNEQQIAALSKNELTLLQVMINSEVRHRRTIRALKAAHATKLSRTASVVYNLLTKELRSSTPRQVFVDEYLDQLELMLDILDEDDLN